jgi:hypothetical protein
MRGSLMLLALQERVAPVFPIPVGGWLGLPGYERHFADVTGGRLAKGREQHFYDIEYEGVGYLEMSVTRSGRPWIDALRVLDAIQAGFKDTLYYAFLRYDADWVQAISLVPVTDIAQMLALDALEDDLLSHAASVRKNARERSGWPRGHISLHRTIPERDVLEVAQNRDRLFSGAVAIQARLGYFEQALKGYGVACAVFDPSTGVWH